MNRVFVDVSEELAVSIFRFSTLKTDLQVRWQREISNGHFAQN